MKGNVKQWTVMVYLAGDNNLDGAGVIDLREMKKVGSTDQINVIAQFDRQGRDISTRRFFLRSGGAIDDDAVMNLGETNTGDPNVLEDFILWGAKNYPAQHYLLVIWNHGQGWDDTNVYRMAKGKLKLNINRRGLIMGEAIKKSRATVPFNHVRSLSTGRFHQALFSTSIEKSLTTRAIALDDNAMDFLDNVELKKLLLSVKKKLGQKIDIFGMDACLMSMAEVMYQIRDSVLCGVGSEETEPGDGWPYDSILFALASKPNMTPQELSAIIVKKYLISYSATDGVTQSACDLSRAKEMATAIDVLARALTQGLSNLPARAAIIKSRSQVQSYANPDYVDLGDFCKLLQMNGIRPDIKSACSNVTDVLFKNKIIFSSGYKGKVVRNSHGLSIYFPLRKISPLYSRLDFNKKTVWGNFLKNYLDKTVRR
jgi:hypothetical protein